MATASAFDIGQQGPQGSPFPVLLEQIVPGELIPLLAIALTFGIPIVAILTSHQRKMAELIHQGQGDHQSQAALMHELQSLRAEVAQLRASMHQQALDLDDLRPLARRDLQQRIGESDANG